MDCASEGARQHLMQVLVVVWGGLQVAAMVVGLGGGALPMFLHNHLPFSQIQVYTLTRFGTGVGGQLMIRC